MIKTSPFSYQHQSSEDQFEDGDNIPLLPTTIGEIMIPSHIPPQRHSQLHHHSSTASSQYSSNLNPTLGNSTSISSREGRNSGLNKSNNIRKRESSPFFRPSTPQPITITQTVSTPNGTHILQQKTKRLLLRSKGPNRRTDIPERKSSILGAMSNMITSIVGAGIIGIPYAVHQTGLIAGIILMVIVAILTDKSLRILIETGKHADVQSYEMLMEAVFGGRLGFVFISANMFIMSFGAMVCYLLIIKETFASICTRSEALIDFLSIFGFDVQDMSYEYIGKCFLVLSSMCIILPLSMQRDMANLSTTSAISVLFDILMVIIVAISSPIQESVQQKGGIVNVMTESTIHFSTLFIGLGVLSFAFVCQDSSFIIAGSLHRPTKQRWALVTHSSLFICTSLAITIGVTGYLGFLDKTRGNVLENFLQLPNTEMIFGSIYTYQAINVARTLLGLTMFCVYPLSSYVARHVLIVLLFSGKTAHTGDDHSVLARWDRRILLTFVLYICALVPALLCSDLGTVLALTGTVAGSCLSYLGPGVAYLCVHGLIFLKYVGEKWNMKNPSMKSLMWNFPLNVIDTFEGDLVESEPGWVLSTIKVIAWYIFMMPLWTGIAKKGGENFKEFEQNQVGKSLLIRRRLGIIKQKCHDTEDNSTQPIFNTVQQAYDSMQDSNVQTNNNNKQSGNDFLEEEYQPMFKDFLLAIAYIVLGFVALVAGIYSISVE